MNQAELVEAVRAVMAEKKNDGIFAAAVVDAMRLADMYEYIKPADYVLPLDAMAGHPVPAFKAG